MAKRKRLGKKRDLPKYYKRYRKFTKAQRQFIEQEAKRFNIVYGTPRELKKRGWGKRAISKQITKYSYLLKGSLQRKYLTQFNYNFKEILRSLGGLTPEIDKLLSVYTRREELDKLAKLYPSDELHQYTLYYEEGRLYDTYEGSEIVTEKIKALYEDIIKAYGIKKKDIEVKLGISKDFLDEKKQRAD